MPLVEVIPHKGTDPQTIATVVQLAKRQENADRRGGQSGLLCEPHSRAVYK